MGQAMVAGADELQRHLCRSAPAVAGDQEMEVGVSMRDELVGVTARMMLRTDLRSAPNRDFDDVWVDEKWIWLDEAKTVLDAILERLKDYTEEMSRVGVDAAQNAAPDRPVYQADIERGYLAMLGAIK